MKHTKKNHQVIFSFACYCFQQPQHVARIDKIRHPREGGDPENQLSMDKTFCVYILANHRKGTLYIGVTSNLAQRVYQHKKKFIDGVTKKYSIDKLVYFEVHRNPNSAITREKQMKKWRRDWKLRLIEKMNSTWKDLYEEIC